MFSSISNAQIGESFQISGEQVTFGDVADFLISPDGQWVVYRADQNTDSVFELFSVPIAGGTPVRLNSNLPVGGELLLIVLVGSLKSALIANALSIQQTKIPVA